MFKLVQTQIIHVHAGVKMTDFGNYTLLVVDDDEDLRDILSVTFRKQGFKVLTATNGVEAFDLIQNKKIDLVISDMIMPDGDGLSLLEKIRMRNPDIPVVIFITGFSHVSVDECVARGAKSVFSKPFDQKELLESVKSSLNI